MIKRAFCVMTLCLLLTLWTAGSVIPGLAKDEKLLLSCFDRYAETAHFGVEKRDYPLFSAQLAAFFRHETDDPNAAVHPFLDYEVTHLFDVRNLMDGIEKTARICGAAAILALIWLVCLYRRKRFSFLPGFLAFLLLIAAVILAAVMDFNRIFFLLHEILFTNDLWLLNPQTDLLIALMPEGMFMFLARRILLYILPLISFLLVGALISRKFIQPRQTS